MKKQFLVVALVAVLAICLTTASFGKDLVSKTMNKPSHVADEIVVKFKKGTDQATINAMLAKYGISKKRKSPFWRFRGLEDERFH